MIPLLPMFVLRVVLFVYGDGVRLVAILLDLVLAYMFRMMVI